MNIPEELIDEHGYPTEEALAFIRDFKPTKQYSTVWFAREFLPLIVWNPEWCLWYKRPYKGVQKIFFSTGGWSGNEDIIDAIERNIFLTHFKLSLVSWKAGGHYGFELKLP